MKRFFVIVLFVICLLTVWLQVVRGFRVSDPDTFYHIKAGVLLFSGQGMPWLTQSISSIYPADLWSLYHVVFSFVPSPLMALNFSGFFITVGVLFFLYSFWKLLTVFSVRYTPLWVLLVFLGSADFLFRLNLLRPHVISIALCMWGVYFLIKHNKIGLFVIAIVGTLVEVIPGALGVSALVFLLVRDSENKKRVVYGLLLFAGVFIALFFNPYFPNNIYLILNVLKVLLVSSETGLVVGAELQPYSFIGFIRSNNIIILINFLSLFLIGYRRLFYRSNIDKNTQFLLLINGIFFLLTLHSQRFVEYWVPFAVLFSAYVLDSYIRVFSWEKIRMAFRYWQFWFICFVVASVFGYGAWFNVATVASYLREAPRADLFKDGAQWVKTHSNQADIVFNTQWDEFPQLFYWNDYNYYIVGMDPTFMYVYDKELYWKWRGVSDDAVEKLGSLRDLHRMMWVDFSSRFVFIEKDRNPRLIEFLDSDVEKKYFEAEYEDEETVVYRLR